MTKTESRRKENWRCTARCARSTKIIWIFSPQKWKWRFQFQFFVSFPSILIRIRIEVKSKTHFESDFCVPNSFRIIMADLGDYSIVGVACCVHLRTQSSISQTHFGSSYLITIGGSHPKRTIKIRRSFKIGRVEAIHLSEDNSRTSHMTR